MGRGGSKPPTVKELGKAKALFALGKTYNQVAKELSRDPKSIKKWLTQPEVAQEIVELKKEVAGLYEDLSQRILESITDETIKEAKLRDRVISAGVCTDKSRLLKGQSTQNIAGIFFQVHESYEKDMNNRLKVEGNINQTEEDTKE